MPTDEGLPPDYLVIAHPDEAANIGEALEKLDQSKLRGGEPADMLPDTRGIGRCRICGDEANLTREHVPPRAALNKGRGRGFDLLEWYEAEDLEIPESGPIFQGGVWAYLLCESCNNATGRYGREYGTWAREAAAVLVGTEKRLADLDQMDRYAYVNVHLVDVYPGRFVRQAVSMFLSISGSTDLGERHPELRQLALGHDPLPLPEPLRMYVTLYAGPIVRFAGGPWGQPMWSFDLDTWSWVMEIAFPPFAFQLLIEGDTNLLAGVDISDFTRMSTEDARSFDIEGWMIGFGHTPHPLDYRPLGLLKSSE